MYPYIHIFNLTIPMYGLCMAIGVFVTAFFVIRRVKPYGICTEDTIVVIAATIGAALCGGILLYVFVTYTPEQIFSYIANLDFSFLTNGGIVFYGGLIAGVFTAIITIKLLKIDVSSMEKAAVPFIPLGHAIGRVGCFFAGCCHGFEYSGPFAVTNVIISPGKTFFPVQLVEAALDVVIVFVILAYIRKERKRFEVLSLYLVLYSVMRFGTEFLRADAIRGSFLMFSTSQWISIGIVLFLSAVKLVSMKSKAKY